MAPSLLLHPTEAQYAPDDIDVIVNALTDIGFIGEPLNGDRRRIGSAFPRLVTFLGCSPALGLNGNQFGSECYVEIQRATPSPVFVHGERLRAPRCPHCGGLTPGIQLPKSALDELVCRRCGRRSPLCAFGWRRSACCARVWVAIRNVAEGEVVPTDRLLDLLSAVSGLPWDYCYVR